MDNGTRKIAIENGPNVDDMKDEADKQEFGNMVITRMWERMPFGLSRHTLNRVGLSWVSKIDDHSIQGPAAMLQECLL